MVGDVLKEDFIIKFDLIDGKKLHEDGLRIAEKSRQNILTDAVGAVDGC